MAFTNEEESGVKQMLAAFQSAKRINELPWATGRLTDMSVPVQDESGETRRMNLAEAVETASNPIAGRYWDESNASPVAAGYYGSLSALKELPQKMGLGRYLVTDDRVRHKLDPTDSTRYEDGRPAKLDGSHGQCIWGWNAHYYTTWKEGHNTVETITFQPIPGKNSIFVPEGGISWLSAGVIDRTEQKLCSIISTDERYRGGNGSVLSAYINLADDAPQKTMLGMPVTAYPYGDFSTLARKRGEGWEACWYVARAVVEYTMRIILGTRNSQSAYNPNLDADGLYQGGLGYGVTMLNSVTWTEYNGCYPIVPTSVGLEKGDGVGVVEYSVTNADGTSVYVAPVPVFFGLVNPFGHLWGVVGGLVFDIGETRSLAYVAPSMYAPFSWTDTTGMLLAAELPRTEGYIKQYSTHLLVCVPTVVGSGATAATYFSDYFYTDWQSSKGFCVRLIGGTSYAGTPVGAFVTNASFETTKLQTTVSSPLCYFKTDPVMGE